MKYSNFTKNNDFEINCEIDGKINLYSYFADCGFKSLKLLINKIKLYLKQCFHIVSSVNIIKKGSKNRNVSKTNKRTIVRDVLCVIIKNQDL